MVEMSEFRSNVYSRRRRRSQGRGLQSPDSLISERPQPRFSVLPGGFEGGSPTAIPGAGPRGFEPRRARGRISEALELFRLEKRGALLSQDTINFYDLHLNEFVAWLAKE